MIEKDINEMNPSRVIPDILMPLPDHDFDPTESAIPWKECISRGWRVIFSTEHGNIAQTDLNRLNGPLPGLLSAGPKAQTAYRQMTQEPSYEHPIPYVEVDPNQFEAILLPGGDGLRMRQYLESSILQNKVLQFYRQGKLIGAICHGVLVLARTIDPQTGHSILNSHKVTAIPKSLDRLAYLLDSWLVKHGYIMYSCCVAEEVRACLKRPEEFYKGSSILIPYVVTDGNIITSRWYMDAELFASRFADALQHRINAANVPITHSPPV